MLRYKKDVIEALKDAGFSSYVIRKDALINQTALQKLREGRMIAWEQFEKVCSLLNCQPGDLIEYVQDEGK